MNVTETHLRMLNIPTDIIDAAKALGVSFKALLTLILTHSLDEVRTLLQNLLAKLPTTV